MNLRHLYKTMSGVEIGALVGRSSTWVYQKLREQGIQTRGKGRRRIIDGSKSRAAHFDLDVVLFKRGFTKSEIAKIRGISRQAISDGLRRRGYTGATYTKGDTNA